VEIDGRRFSSAWANSKKEAEQNAALIALQELDLAKTDDKGNIIITEDMSPPPGRRKKRSKGKKKSVRKKSS